MYRLKNNYLESVKWLDLLNENKIVPGLDRIKKVMKILKNPQNNIKVIVV